MKYFGILLLLVPFFALAHGGDQRIVNEQYMVSLSRAPLTPRVGSTTQMNIYFVDLQKDVLVKDDIVASVKIAKLGEANSRKQNYVFQKEDIQVKGGAFDLHYTFGEPGIHEVFVSFRLANEESMYAPEDFMIDVQPQTATAKRGIPPLGAGAAGLVLGFLISRFSSRFL